MSSMKRKIKRSNKPSSGALRRARSEYGAQAEYYACKCGRLWLGDYEHKCPSCKRKRA